jgi:ligand-binding SRPBCC domain-containing protein
MPFELGKTTESERSFTNKQFPEPNANCPMIKIEKDPQEGYRLIAEMTIQRPRSEVFAFFSDAMQLEKITPPWLNFSVLTKPPIEMREGLLLDYQLYLHRVPIKWRTEIAVWEPDNRFVDQQLRGPYKRWYHEHTFEEVEGATICRDNVHYIPRGGRFIHNWFVRPDLEKIFTYRQQKLSEIFAATPLVAEEAQPGAGSRGFSASVSG